MPRHSETKVLPYSPAQMFDLVADVGQYPQFLPWVIGARIRSRSDTDMVADLIIGFKMFREKFTSRVNMERPSRIDVDYVEGPLEYLHNEWQFAPADGGGTKVDFCVDFQFRNKLFERMVGGLFSEAVRRMVSAFETRAAELYGPAPAAQTFSSSSSSATRTA